MATAGITEASSLLRVELPWLTPEATEEFATLLRRQFPASAIPTLRNRTLQRLSQELTPERYLRLMISKVRGSAHHAPPGSPLQELSMHKFILLPTGASGCFRLALDPEAGRTRRKKTIKDAIAFGAPVDLFYGAQEDAGRTVFPLSMHEWGLRGRGQAGHRSYRWDALWYAVPFTAAPVSLWDINSSRRGHFLQPRQTNRISYSFEQARDLHIASSVQPRTGLRTFEVTVCEPGEPLTPPKEKPKHWWLRTGRSDRKLGSDEDRNP